jgi:hypothetical protein
MRDINHTPRSIPRVPPPRDNGSAPHTFDLQLPGNEELVQNVVRFVKVEDQIELTHVTKVAVEDLWA